MLVLFFGETEPEVINKGNVQACPFGVLFPDTKAQGGGMECIHVRQSCERWRDMSRQGNSNTADKNKSSTTILKPILIRAPQTKTKATLKPILIRAPQTKAKAVLKPILIRAPQTKTKTTVLKPILIRAPQTKTKATLLKPILIRAPQTKIKTTLLKPILIRTKTKSRRWTKIGSFRRE